jgi:hypothetical protein
LRQLQHLIEDVLPAAPDQENESTLVHLPVVDTPATRAQLAHLAHSAFEADVVALRKDLERFIIQAQSTTRRGRPGTIKPESMASRLEQYAALRAQVAFFRDTLGMRDEEILRRVAGLEAAALRLLATATPRRHQEAPARTDTPTAQEAPQTCAVSVGHALRP